MRYLWPLLFVGFIFLSIDFATQNTAEVTLLYTIDWLNLTFRSTRPLFVPLFFTLAWGILFCVVYFFLHHSVLLGQLRIQTTETRRLKRLVLLERDKVSNLELRIEELQQITERVQLQLEFQTVLLPSPEVPASQG
jgi:uncharacterized integral membrane protein|tara:strand:+ start:2194 stop:2601 length:408 start_codon:yes stop_codon:yes gene_type:complete